MKKGSRKIRLMIQKTENINFNLETANTVTTFCRLIDCPVPVSEFLKTWIGVWRTHYLPSDLKNFIYNCRFNSLPLNNRLNSYRPEIDARCTFCRIVNNDTVQRDGFNHCFLHCRTTFNILTNIVLTIGLNIDIDSVAFSNLYWFGIDTDKRETQLTWLIFFDVFRYVIYKSRLRKIVPNFGSISHDMNFTLRKLMLSNRKFRDHMLHSGNLANFTQAIG
jgi:hypothetical protein